MTIEYINSHHALFPQVKQLGKKYAATLGFMPVGGFDDYGAGKCIITASEGDTLQGYLMYREVKRFSRVTIVHLVIDAPYRHNGIHTQLLDALRDKYKYSGLQGMSLNCRKDYETASAMWANYGFIARGTKRSRSLEEHYLTMWWYGFHQQRDLFSLAYEESTKVRALMDLNIIVKLRDAEKGVAQLDPKEDPRCLLQDWLVDETELCYAPEVFNEINRDDDLERMKETTYYVTGAFIQAPVDAEQMMTIAQELKEYLPGNSLNTKSDRKQVASCIVAGIPYFLTYDDDVIKKKAEIKAKYDVEIYTPQEFLLRIDQLLHSEEYTPVLLRGVAFHTLVKQDAAGLKENVSRFLNIGKRERKTNFENTVMNCVNNEGQVFTVNSQNDVLAFYGEVEGEDVTTLCFLRIADGPLKGSLLCQIVTNTLQECVHDKKKQIVIKEQYLDDDQKNTLLRYGFLVQKDGTFVKHIRNEVVSKGELSRVLTDAGINAQAVPTTAEQMVRMELVFFPLKIRDMNIPTYIIPIKSYWAGQLFDNVISSEMLFGAIPTKLWSIENVYYRHTNPIREKAPARILWYVSGGGKQGTHKKMMVGCSYLLEVHTGKGQELYRQFKHYGIYEWQHIYELCGGEKDNDIRALKFSHTELFSRPISYDDALVVLARHGYKPNTFASPLQVSKDVFFDIYEIGTGMYLR